MHRRQLLLSVAAVALLPGAARALVLRGDGAPPPETGLQPPVPVLPGVWQFFTDAEVKAMEAVVDRLIPDDDLGIGAREAGCVVFIDRQLAGPFGQAATLYMRPPFMPGLPTQGPQTPLTPAAQYRAALAGLDAHCRGAFRRSFAEIAPAQQDQILSAMETGTLQLPGVHAKSVFDLILNNTREGFFADPIYRGNRGMVGWKLVGFPGARYDYRAEIKRPGEELELPPVGLRGELS